MKWDMPRASAGTSTLLARVKGASGVQTSPSGGGLRSDTAEAQPDKIKSKTVLRRTRVPIIERVNILVRGGQCSVERTSFSMITMLLLLISANYRDLKSALSINPYAHAKPRSDRDRAGDPRSAPTN